MYKITYDWYLEDWLKLLNKDYGQNYHSLSILGLQGKFQGLMQDCKVKLSGAWLPPATLSSHTDG